MDNHVVPQETDRATTLDGAFGNLTTRNLADFGDVEDFKNFSVTNELFFSIW